MLDNKVGQIKLKAARAKGAAHQIEEVGTNLRAMMPWLKENQKVDKSKN
jgi:ketol-acid reductoisomerase